MTGQRSWLVDAAERVVRAFIVAFAGQMLLSSTGALSVSAAKAAAGAGVAAALSVVISLAAAQVGGTVSPASLVKQQPGDADDRMTEADFDRLHTAALHPALLTPGEFVVRSTSGNLTSASAYFSGGTATVAGTVTWTTQPPPDEPPPAAVPAKPRPKRPSGGARR